MSPARVRQYRPSANAVWGVTPIVGGLAPRLQSFQRRKCGCPCQWRCRRKAKFADTFSDVGVFVCGSSFVATL